MESPTRERSYHLRNILESIRNKAEFADAVLPFYILVAVRQYFWGIENDLLAWTLSISASLALFCLYFSTKRSPLPTTMLFWPIVALPLLLIYALRAPFVDVSFDVLNYHIISSQRALHDSLSIPGDFFPIPPVNPMPDMLTGISRYILGYRLGTAVNYLVLIWSGLIIERILRPRVARSWIRCTAVLAILFTEHLLFMINNYMVDLLALPLLLYATYLVITNRNRFPINDHELILLPALLGMSFAFKLTNAAFVIPIGLFYILNLVRSRQLTLKLVLVSSAVFLAPVLVFFIHLYRETGILIFIHYFEPAYWWWGPHGFLQTLAWPILHPLYPERLSELNVYSGRISAGVIAAILSVLLWRKKDEVRPLCFFLLFGSFLWSVGTGYIRYGFYLELIAGTIIVLALSRIAVSLANTFSGKLVFCLSIVLIAVQFCFAAVFVYKLEWSLRPSVFQAPHPYLEEARDLLSDRSLQEYLPDRERTLFERVEVWLNSDFKTRGIQVLLKPEAPVINVEPQYLQTSEGRMRFDQTLLQAEEKGKYSFCRLATFNPVRTYLGTVGLRVTEITPVTVPFFSNHTQINMLLFQVVSSQKTKSGPQTITNQPLPPGGFKARLSLTTPLTSLRRREKALIYVRVMNESHETWPMQNGPSGKYRVSIRNRWFTQEGVGEGGLDGLCTLPNDLQPGEEIEVPIVITAPNKSGNYLLKLDALQEGVGWFEEMGSQPSETKIRVAGRRR